MSKNILALYDTDGDYVMRFLEFAQSRSKNIPFEIRAYTKEKELSAFAAKNPVAILLIAEKLMTDDISTLHTGCIILLTEGVSSEKYKMYPSVSRYRSASSLLKEVFDLYAKDGTEHKEFTAVKGDTKIIGIYSPVSGCLKTSFALTLGQLLSEKYPTICLNFEACAGFSELLHVTYERDIEDLIYYIRTGEANLTDKMNAMTERVGDLAYLPPARSVQDVLSTTIEEWMQLIDLVREKSGFERLILDIGEGVNGLRQMLEICEVIYMPFKEGVIAKAKLSQFRELLRLWDAKMLKEKIKMISFPDGLSPDRYDRYVEQLIFSPLGDYTRDRIIKDGL